MQQCHLRQWLKQQILTQKNEKLIQWPVAWEEKIKEVYEGTVNSYILMAIFERMKKDGFII